MHPINILEAIKNTQGTKAKMEIVASNKDNKELLFLLKTLLDPFEVTNVKSINYKGTIPRYWSSSQDKLRNLVEYLKSTNRSGVTLKAIDDYLASINPKEADIVAEVITKSYKLGLGGKMVNKALGYAFISDFTLMKAEPFKESLIPWHKGVMYVQEKYDGVRCVVKIEGGVCTALTFKGHSIRLPNIFKAALKLAESMGMGDFILDGELMHKTSRTKATSMVNRIMKNDSSEADDTELELKVFYYMTLQEFNDKNSSVPESSIVISMSALTQMWQNKHIVFSETYTVRNMAEVDDLFIAVRKKGGEGLILKNPAGKYEWKRSKNWVKLKSTYSTTLRVIGTYPGTGKYEGLIGGLICATECAKMNVLVGSGLSDGDRIKYLDFDSNSETFVEVAFTDVGWSEEGDMYLDFPRYKGDRSFEKDIADTLEQAVGEVPRYKKGK